MQYGTFCTTTSITGSYVLLFATVSKAQGINLARAPMSSPANTKRYTYWTGSTWSPHPPSPTDTKAHIVTDSHVFSTGDFIYSRYLQTWILIYFEGQLSSTFYLRYSTSGLASGPYSDKVVLHKTAPVQGGFNYAGHAYGGYDPSGKTVLLSWTYKGAQTKMARVTFV